MMTIRPQKHVCEKGVSETLVLVLVRLWVSFQKQLLCFNFSDLFNTQCVISPYPAVLSSYLYYFAGNIDALQNNNLPPLDYGYFVSFVSEHIKSMITWRYTNCDCIYMCGWTSAHHEQPDWLHPAEYCIYICCVVTSTIVPIELMKCK